jgi:hypothetical protein
MAKLEHQGPAWKVVAESDEERALLAHGRKNGGSVTLLEGFYSVRDDALVLPGRATASGARRVCAAFERAALAHREAQRRRDGFRLLKSECPE